MLRTATSFALLALVTASAPLRAQQRPARYDAGSFSLELPSGITGLRLVQRKQDPAQMFEGYVGFGNHGGTRVLVMVNRTVHHALPGDPALRDSAAARRLLADTSSARWRRFRESPADNSPAGQRLFMQVMGDTSLAARRIMVQRLQFLFSHGNDWIRTEGDGREIVTEDRVALRSPATVDLDMGTMRGTGDVSVSRRGMETWVVIFASAERTPALDGAAARMLDSFRATTAAPEATPPE
ncbi:MAG TPA: hypothetical protein VJT67_17240 [Longimicrobiaceae bacterium]|nr:hypothetical protein [Longimicrobiaceae bacterium]